VAGCTLPGAPPDVRGILEQTTSRGLSTGSAPSAVGEPVGSVISELSALYHYAMDQDRRSSTLPTADREVQHAIDGELQQVIDEHVPGR
jgi:hypothetical protein